MGPRQRMRLGKAQMVAVDSTVEFIVDAVTVKVQVVQEDVTYHKKCSSL